MEKYFGNAYRGDPGVPHAQPERFWNIWIASASFSAVTWFNPYIWHWNNAFNAVGMTCHSCTISTTGRKPRLITSPTSSIGMRRGMISESRIITTGLTTSVRMLFLLSILVNQLSVLLQSLSLFA